MSQIKATYNAGGITDQWAAGMRLVEVWRATDWDGTSGTFAEYTGEGTRPSLVEDTEQYVWYDNDGDPSYAYKVRLRNTDGTEVTTFSNVLTVANGGITVIQAQRIYAATLHPSGYLGTWRDWLPSQTLFTENGLRHGGNNAYVVGTDWTCEVCLLYQVASVYEGISLAGATEIIATITDQHGDTVIERKLTDGTIVVPNQAVAHSTGGQMGHLQLVFADDDDPTVGQHHIDLIVTFGGGEIIHQFAGDFDCVATGP